MNIAPEIVERFMEYHIENPAWGWLHVVLDDDNLEDVHVQGCIEDALDHGDDEAAELGKLLLQMTEAEREWIGNLPYQHRR